ncbi:MAG: hypothetical protein ABSH41_03760 [Syntrophobacteraceae bacterium]|jgi:hypothetical protein
MIEPKDIENRFAYHAPSELKVKRHAFVRESIKKIADTINVLVPDGREKALAITHLEDAMMWANAGIARNPEV